MNSKIKWIIFFLILIIIFGFIYFRKDDWKLSKKWSNFWSKVTNTSMPDYPANFPPELVYPDTKSMAFVDYRDTLDIVKLDYTSNDSQEKIIKYYQSLSRYGWTSTINRQSEVNIYVDLYKSNYKAQARIMERVGETRVVLIWEF